MVHALSNYGENIVYVIWSSSGSHVSQYLILNTYIYYLSKTKSILLNS